MNVQLIPKPVTVHKVLEMKGSTIIAACGHWLDRARYTETSVAITCKKCLEYLSGGNTSQEQGL